MNESQDQGQEADIKEEHKTEEKPKKEEKLVTLTQHELEQLKHEIHENKDKYLRLLAESENMRKRLQKEKMEMSQYAIQNSICDFLIPIDHLENALKFTQNMSDDVKNWALGFQMILNQFKDVLSNHGVQPFDSVGTHFDPHKHEAIETEETKDQPPGMVIEESLKGYKMGTRIIRPARVKVSKAPAVPNDDKEKEE